MPTTRRIVEEELGQSETAALISAAIQILANESYSGVMFPNETIINLTWKAKHMIEANAEALKAFPLYEQQNIIKLYLEGEPVSQYLKASRTMEPALNF